MIKFTFKNVDSVFKLANKALVAAIQNTNLLTEVGVFMRDRIVRSTQRGISQVTGESFKKLSSGYRSYRKKFQNIHPGETGDFFAPNKANNTFTGQVLRSLDFKVDRLNSSVTVEPDDNLRDPVPQISLKKIKEPTPITNRQVAKELADKGRAFLGLDKDGKERVKKMVIAELRRQLSRSGL